MCQLFLSKCYLSLSIWIEIYKISYLFWELLTSWRNLSYYFSTLSALHFLMNLNMILLSVFIWLIDGEMFWVSHAISEDQGQLILDIFLPTNVSISVSNDCIVTWCIYDRSSLAGGLHWWLTQSDRGSVAIEANLHEREREREQVVYIGDLPEMTGSVAVEANYTCTNRRPNLFISLQ